MKKVVVVLGLVAALGAALAVPGAGYAAATRPDAVNLSPGLFATASTGVALIKTYGCQGRPLGSGSGFLVGSSVVMTARHVLTGACRAKVVVGGDSIWASHWVFWRRSPEAADLGVIKLSRASTGHVFRFRNDPPPFGTTCRQSVIRSGTA